ncbi:DUF7800 domain-containing protein [Ornithinicoccus halotolerans]|uniref:DUF7800 domain-containing protein n=1 Tax=Ornithinicoccus halotolerans TaxID=1748220 RepID=UPI001E4DD47F|nr:alkaline phosphatase D family protein [Ornithinicoccus halotolerans]
MNRLLLGPMVRHVDTTSAAVWVQTEAAGTVSVHLPPARQGEPERVWREPTFAVHGYHYALVEVTGLHPGERVGYRVEVDGQPVWPEPDSRYPAPVLRTLVEDEPLHLAFGSCRTSVPHDRHHHLTHGVDALRSWGLALATGEQAPLAGDGRPGFAGEPDLLLLLGDQVYADSTSRQMREFIASRRDTDQPPWEELKDYVEYAHLYLLAWSDPALRWLLSWLPTLMIFDDHDVRDDWNTSLEWRREMEATSWWHERIVAGLASYWVYQHLGNLSVGERAADEVWVELRRRQSAGDGEVDLTEVLEAFAARVDRQPETYRWSYARNYGEARLVVVDSRAARLLEPGARSMLDAEEMAWLDGQLQGDCDHLIVGTSLPYLLPEGLHYLEAWNEAMVDGRWGPLMARAAERLRQVIDLEHWAAFNGGFEQVARMVTEVADGRRGRSPSSVLFLSGDVHHSYVTEVQRAGGSRVLQLVCSPIRNPLPRAIRLLTAVLAHGVARPVGAALARSAKVPEASLTWKGVAGPWFDNNLAVLRVEPESHELRVVWLNGAVEGGDHDRPQLGVVADVELDVPPPGSPRRPPAAHVHPSRRTRVRMLRRRVAWAVAGTVAWEVTG